MKNKEKKKEVKQEKENFEVVKVKKRKSSNEILRKWLANTTYTIILVAIIITAYIGINYLFEKLNLNNIDLSKEQMYSLSDASKQIAKSIEQDVNIILVNMSDIESVVSFANQYSKENSKIKVQEIKDITKYPEITKKYDLTSDSYGIIIECGEREKLLSVNDLYTYDYTTYEEKDITEEAISNALLDVSVTDKPKIYFLTGHNDSVNSYMNYFKQKLTSEANEVEDLNILIKGEIPEDCSALVITTLDEDITKVEKDAILKYIKNGGEILLLADANVTKINMPNFQKVLDEYGISISEGVLLEQDTEKMLMGFPAAIIVTVNSGTSITKNLNMELDACFINPGRIEFKDEEKLEKLGVEVETLATTSSKTFYREDLSITSSSKQKSDQEGSATVGALLTKTIDDETKSKLIVYSNNVFITEIPYQINSQSYLYAYEICDNDDLALNSLAYLTGREDTIMIRKTIETTIYTVTQQQHNIIMTIIFGVPALIIVAGIIVWIVRRRKK